MVVSRREEVVSAGEGWNGMEWNGIEYIIYI
jgi:hypothetical protein